MTNTTSPHTTPNGDKWLKRVLWSLSIAGTIAILFMTIGRDRAVLAKAEEKIPQLEQRVGVLEASDMGALIRLDNIEKTQEKMDRKLDKIIDLHLKTNGGGLDGG